MIIPMQDLSGVAPEIILICFALFILMIQFFKTGVIKTYLPYISLAGVLISGFLIIYSFDLSSAPFTFNQGWNNDQFARIFKIILLLGTGLSILISIQYVKQANIEASEFYFLLLFATVGMMAMVSGTDMITIFLGLELMSICLYVLAGVLKSRIGSVEASLKYFILGSFATGFLLYGIAFIYGATGTTNLFAISHSIVESNTNHLFLIIGMILLLAGIGFKIAVVPFHMWTPDVYEGSPGPITAFMSVVPKAATFAILIRILTFTLPAANTNWTTLLWIVSVSTMTVGNLIALKQTSVKRMLAYSGIAHTGYLMIGLVVQNQQGISAILFYLMTYVFMNIGAFTIVILVARQKEKRTKCTDYSGLLQSNPFLTIAMTIFLLSLAGIPPTGGFMGKFYIFMSAIESDYMGLAVIGVLNSVISLYYYLKVTIMMYMRDPVDSLESISLSPAMALVLIISILGIFQLGILPSGYISLAKSVILQ